MSGLREAILKQVPYIRYLTIFQEKSVSTLPDLKSEVNTIHSTFAKELGLPIRLTNVKAQKIDYTMLDTYKMAVSIFLVTDKANQVRFFERPS